MSSSRMLPTNHSLVSSEEGRAFPRITLKLTPSRVRVYHEAVWTTIPSRKTLVQPHSSPRWSLLCRNFCGIWFPIGCFSGFRGYIVSSNQADSLETDTPVAPHCR